MCLYLRWSYCLLGWPSPFLLISPERPQRQKLQGDFSMSCAQHDDGQECESKKTWFLQKVFLDLFQCRPSSVQCFDCGDWQSCSHDHYSGAHIYLGMNVMSSRVTIKSKVYFCYQFIYPFCLTGLWVRISGTSSCQSNRLPCHFGESIGSLEKQSIG